MTANDYYNSEPLRRPNEAPLPPLPNVYSAYNPHQRSQSRLSSVESHQDDSYQLHPQRSHGSDHGYHGAGYGVSPYSDDIPLRPHPKQTSSDMYGHDQQRYFSEGAYPPQDPAVVDRSSRSDRRSRRGLFSGKIPWVVYAFTLIQVAVFIAELIRNGVLTKTPIQTKPSFNPMIGPSPYVRINMGARFVPCMRSTPQGKDTSITWPCPASVSSDPASPDNKCTLSELCGFGGSNTNHDIPNQWFRFIIPIFLHSGIIHIAFNLLLQLTLGREMEKEIGSLRFLLVYLCSGIFGFVLGGNFAPSGLASVGASGALFGVIALILLDLLYHWRDRRSPWTELAWIILEIVVSFVLGLLPGLDNFSHIGGFLMGLVLGVCILRSPDVLRQRIGVDKPLYGSVNASRKLDDVDGGIRGFVKQPVGFFKGRKPLWWTWWLVRAAALIGVLACFIVLLKNFYKENPTTCSWCKHLSCLVSLQSYCIVPMLTGNTAYQELVRRWKPPNQYRKQHEAWHTRKFNIRQFSTSGPISISQIARTIIPTIDEVFDVSSTLIWHFLVFKVSPIGDLGRN